MVAIAVCTAFLKLDLLIFFTTQYIMEIQARLSLFEEYYSSLEQPNLILDDFPRLLDERLLCLGQRGSGLLLPSHGGGKVTGGHAYGCCLHLSQLAVGFKD